MNRYLQKIILENEELINNNKWDIIYARIWALYGRSTISDFTNIMTDAGIFPIYHLEYIPEGFHFNDLKIKYESIPSNIKTISAASYQWCSYLEIIDFSKATNLTAIEGDAFQFCVKLTEITFSENLKRIGSAAFAGCASLTNINLNSKLEVIESKAFLGTALSEVILPDNIGMIGNSCFPPSCILKVHENSLTADLLTQSKTLYKVEYV